MKQLVLIALVAFLLTGAGCHKVKSDATVEVGPDKLKTSDLPPAKSIVINFESKDNVPITIVLVKTEEADAALKAVEGGKSPEQAMNSVKQIAMQTGAKGSLISPETDSRVKYSVLLHSKKPTMVTLKTNGK